MDIDGSTQPAAGVFEAIAALVAEHAWLIDHGQADRIAALYVSDGRMLSAGPDPVGRAAMRERTSRHVCTNPRLVGDYENVFRRDRDGRWLFAERRITPAVGGA